MVILRKSTKDLRYFDCGTKDKESDANPYIIYSQLYAAQIPWFIQQRAEEIAREVKGKFTVLVISATRTQCRTIVESF